MKRTPQEIFDTLTAIEAFWLAHPSWRLAQIVVNGASEHNPGFHTDPFACEDADLLDGLRKLERQSEVR